MTKRKIKKVMTNEAQKAVKKGGVHHSVTTIRGILVPADWDEEGNVLAVAVSTLTENEFVIEPDSKGQELLKLLRKDIEVTGLVGKGRKDRRTIAVKSYALTNG
ncbi:MAG: hypothetical protein JSV01_05555 [Desulfobacterales bacterium]|nr:MAG: hypothetical protein JSV01_05555 [Desulfobacterales bacterium]